MAIELIDKIKQKNNGNFKLVDAIDVELKDGSDLQNFIDNINDIVDMPSSSKCHNVVQGENEPEQDDVIIWVDTSNSENVYSDSLGDKVINEFREIFKYLTNEIKELKAKNLDLEARVSFLEQKLDAIIDVRSIVYSTIRDETVRQNVANILTSAKFSGDSTKAEMQQETTRLKEAIEATVAVANDAVNKNKEKLNTTSADNTKSKKSKTSAPRYM